MSQQIHIQIDKHGNSRIVDMTGFGTNCQAASREIEKTLGKVVESSRHLTDSFLEELPPSEIQNDLT